MTAATISAYEKGIKTPVLETVIKLADALVVSIDWLCGAEKTQEKVETYADVISNLINALLPIEYDVRCFNDYENPFTYTERHEISILDDKLIPFIVGLGKMKTLFDDGTIDATIFNSWLEGQKTIYKNIRIADNKGIKDENEPSDFLQLDIDGELPF